MTVLFELLDVVQLAEEQAGFLFEGAQFRPLALGENGSRKLAQYRAILEYVGEAFLRRARLHRGRAKWFGHEANTCASG
jgi:hypothetical protein